MEFVDRFDPLDPASCPDWERRADEYLRAKVKEAREKEPRLPWDAEPSAMSDLVTMLRGEAGDSGTCVDGVVEMDSEREALVQQILAARKKGVGTGLPCDGN